MGTTYHQSAPISGASIQGGYESSITTLRGTILVLDSGDAIEPSLVRSLENSGYTLLQAHTFDEALQRLAAGDHEAQILIANEHSLPSLNDGAFTQLREVSPIPIRIIVLSHETGMSDDKVDQPDALLAWPWHEQEVLAHVQSQLRAQKTISELVASRSVMLGTSLLTIDMLGTTRTELSTQATLHHELLQRVHTHIGALRDYLELEVRRLPLGIARESMRGVLYRLRNMSALYDTMAILSLEDPVDFCKLSTRIGQGVKAIYSPRSKLPLAVEGELMLPSASASPLALIVNELVTNAYRHAFPGGRFGKIVITCGREEQLAWCKVEDNGVGMAALPNVPPGKVSGTLLVQRLLRSSLGGTCSWQSNEHGTIATVRFPAEAA